MRYFFALLALLLMVAPRPADSRATEVQTRAKSRQVRELQARVISCHDGDTCRMQELRPKSSKDRGQDRDGEKFSVRFSGIDAPELGQASAVEAKRYLESLLRGKEVRLLCDGRSFERRTCDVYLGELHVQHDMVSKGWAWDSPKYSKGRYAPMQAEARKAKIGIWKNEGPDLRSPACHRAKSKQAQRHCARDPRFQE